MAKAGRSTGSISDRGLETSTAWSAVLATAVMYRRQLKEQWNPYTKRKGVSPRAKMAKNHLVRLQGLVDSWKIWSPDFEEQWEMYGGDRMVSQFLDQSY